MGGSCDFYDIGDFDEAEINDTVLSYECDWVVDGPPGLSGSRTSTPRGAEAQCSHSDCALAQTPSTSSPTSWTSPGSSTTPTVFATLGTLPDPPFPEAPTPSIAKDHVELQKLLAKARKNAVASGSAEAMALVLRIQAAVDEER